MKPGLTGRLLILLLFLGKLAGISAQQPTAPLIPALLTGTVTNAITGAAVIGAKITVNDQTGWSVFGGVYSIQVDPLGSYTVQYQKPGFDTYTSPVVNFQSGQTVTMDVTLWESLNPPAAASAVLDTVNQRVHIAWQLPNGAYTLLYDDGIQEAFTIWASQGNLNAVRFTPPAWPARVTGGLVHIGSQADYPAGGNPYIPFQVLAFDAGGPQGMPGSQIAGPVDVIPTHLGWNEFTFPAPGTLSSGDFYLVMVQGGNPPNAAGLAIDNTSVQLRSVSRFITGGGGWLPAGGNFMMRAVAYGPGGPLNADSLGESLLQYQVYRLRQGEEQNPSVWTDLGTTTSLSKEDYAWNNLPCGPYRWGIRALYSGNRSSPAKFTNVLGKCWTVGATIRVALSCEEADRSGAFIRLKNLVYPDTVYTFTVDTSGRHTFPHVWKGSYELSVKKFGYQDHTSNISLSFDTTVPVLLLQKRPPPTGLQVDPKSLVTQWEAPTYSDTLFMEDWTSGSFLTNGWTRTGGNNWIISSATGNPAPSVMFSWSLVSKPIAGLHSPILTCRYDIYLDNFGTTTLNQMAVEVWDGSAWSALKNYTNQNGNIPWTTDEVDISAVTDADFRIRFRAYGEDSYDVNGWNVDNIMVSASETEAGLLNCILGYNVYLDQVLAGFTTDTKFVIPGPLVQYGQSYEACVLAAYGSGYSPKVCTQFTSAFLYPPRNLSATAIENTVNLVWLPPRQPDSTAPPGLTGYRIYRNNALIRVIHDPDSLSHYDLNLEPGAYQYGVSATYDLSAYGYPGEDESMRAGPVTVVLNYGRELPFLEPWDQASFSYNEWRFTPAQGNWAIDAAEGAPAPAAKFSGEPVQTDYDFSLESPVLDATPFDCARIWLDVDVKLEDRQANGEEKLCVEVYYNTMWHKMTEYLNNGSFDWQARHIDISAVAQQAFRVRFRATGHNSANLTGWLVDNIHIYPVCYPAQHLEGEALGYDVRLTWSPPACQGTGGQLNEGFEGATFPPPGWDRLITNDAATWSHTTASSSLGVHSGNFSAGLLWDYSHQDEWLIVRDIAVTGNLTFWSHAFQGSAYNDHYYVKVSPDGGSSWEVVLDMSALSPYPSFNGYNLWETPYEVDMTPFLGQTVDIAWQAVDGDGQGIWYSWAIDDCTIGSDGLTLNSYEIWRSTGGSGDFVKINTAPVTDTTYLDQGLPPMDYHYYILAFSPGCQQSEPSDTVTVDVITSAGQTDHSPDLLVFPNPARQQITVRSAETIRSIRLSTVSGVEVLRRGGEAGHQVVLGTASVPEGLYFLQISTDSGSMVQKIVITH